MTRNASSRLLAMAVLIFIQSQQQLYFASSTSDYHSNSLSGRGSRDLLLDLLVGELEEVAGTTDELLVDIDMGNSALAVEFLEVSLDGGYDKMSQHPTIIHFPFVTDTETYDRHRVRRVCTNVSRDSLKLCR